MGTPSPDRGLEVLLRELAPPVLGAMVRRFRNFADAEDAVQEAMIAAATQWPREGVPDNPRGWLVHVAQRRLTDRLRSDIARRNREEAAGADLPTAVTPALWAEPGLDPQDTLVLLFMCCHPVLGAASAIALTLRAVGGLATAEIASAFLVPEATIGQRISRAKQTLRTSGIPLEPPDAAERSSRLGAVLQVLYLIFNEGYVASAGRDLHRVDLSVEAIRLTRQVRALLPGDGEVAGLLALMLLTDARRAARTGPLGELIPLDEQDRALWDQAAIREGVALVEAAFLSGPPGEYLLQAAIAVLHDEAPSVEATDWPQITALYAMLGELSPGPVTALNHAVAVAMVEGPETGLAWLEPLESDPRLSAGHRLHAVKGHLLERAGRLLEAEAAYRRAALAAASVPERDYLLLKAARLAFAREHEP